MLELTPGEAARFRDLVAMRAAAVPPEPGPLTITYRIGGSNVVVTIERGPWSE
jgi:hypothetical protein